jgi:protein-S-isoprenylcysteine O-methyltransferase Ste14
MPQNADRADIPVLPPFIPASALAIGLGLQFLWPARIYPGDGASWFGGLLLAIAVALAGSAAWTMISASTHLDVRKPSKHLVTSGVFEHSRNPIYASMVLVVLAAACIANSLWLLLLAAPTALALQKIAIEPEERYLERKFGREYLDYKARVGRWL